MRISDSIRGAAPSVPSFATAFPEGTLRGSSPAGAFPTGLQRDAPAPRTGTTGYPSATGTRTHRIVNCTVERNEKVGILFREPRPAFRGGHRNVIESCEIRDNGFAEQGVGIDLRGETQDVIIRGNVIEDSGRGEQRVGIRIDGRATGTVTEGNRFRNLKTDVECPDPHATEA